MHKTRLVAVLLALCLNPIISPAATTEGSFPLFEVEDGDTLVFEINGKNERIQLTGIDAPEDTENPKFKLDLKKTSMSEAQLLSLGRAATEHIGALLADSQALTLRADFASKDRYGRIPAIVLDANGKSVAEQMVLDGYAVALPTPNMDTDQIERLERMERFSRQAGNGLWQTHAVEMRNWYDRTR